MRAHAFLLAVALCGVAGLASAQDDEVPGLTNYFLRKK